MKKSSEYNPMEIFHGLILEVFHEERNKKNARELMILSGLDLNSIIVEAKKRAAAKSASQLTDNDVKKVLIQGERIQRIGELEEEIEKLKDENEKLKVRELKAYHDGYKDGLTACNTVGAEEALEDRDFHYCKWIEKKEQGDG